MAEEKKKGVLSKLFGARKSGCCNLKIEEVPGEETKDADNEACQSPNQSSCCGGQPKQANK